MDKFRIITESGTLYVINGLARTVTRYPGRESFDMRKDGIAQAFHDDYPIAVPRAGHQYAMHLEPLGEGDMTIRVTSPVTEIEYHD